MVLMQMVKPEKHQNFRGASLLRIILCCCLFIFISACKLGDKPYHSHKPTDGTIHIAALSPNGNLALLSAKPTNIVLWNLKQKKPIHELEHSHLDQGLDDVVFSTDSNYALTSSNNIITLWGLKTGSRYATWDLPAKVTAIALSENGRFALAATEQNELRYIDLRTGKTIRSFKHGAKILSISLSPDNTYAITGGIDHIAKVWQLKDGHLLYSWIHKAPVNQVKFSPLGNYAMTSAKGRGIKIWRINDGMLHQSLDSPPLFVTSAKFSPDENFLIAGCQPQNLEMWNIHSGKSIKRWVLPKRSFWKPTAITIHDLTFTPNMKHIITLDSLGFGHVWRNPV